MENKRFRDLKVGDKLFITKRKGIEYEYVEKEIKAIKILKTKPMKITLDDCEYEIKLKNINDDFKVIWVTYTITVIQEAIATSIDRLLLETTY